MFTQSTSLKIPDDTCKAIMLANFTFIKTKGREFAGCTCSRGGLLIINWDRAVTFIVLSNIRKSQEGSMSLQISLKCSRWCVEPTVTDYMICEGHGYTGPML